MNYSFHAVDACNMCGCPETKVMGRRLNTSQGLTPKKRIGIATTVVKCTGCSLVYANPMPVPERISDHYGLPPESYWKPEYFEVPKDYFSYQFERIGKITNGSTFNKYRTFLDVGCGIGKTLTAALNRGYDAFGLEASEPFYERAVERIDKSRIKLSSFEDAVYPDESFDVVNFGVVLEHLYDPSASIEKALKWLKPGGVIHIEVPDSGYLVSKLMNLYFRLRMTDFVVNISPMHSPFHLYEFTDRSFAANGERLGYKVAFLERYAGAVGSLSKLNNILAPVMNVTGTGMGLVVYLQKSHRNNV